MSKRPHNEATVATIFSLPSPLLRSIALFIGTTKEEDGGAETMASLLFTSSVSPSILFVGSGNFTFESSVSHLRSHKKGVYGAFNHHHHHQSQTDDAGPHLCATSYDSLDDLHQKYGKEEMDITLSILSKNNAKILHGINAQNINEEMAAEATTTGSTTTSSSTTTTTSTSSTSTSTSSSTTTQQKYDLIVFNFPKVAVTSLEEFRIAGRVPRNRYLIASFLRTASQILNKNGHIIIAQKTGHPYRCWTCTSAAKWVMDIEVVVNSEKSGSESGSGSGNRSGSDSLAAAAAADSALQLTHITRLPFLKHIFCYYRAANVSPEGSLKRRKVGFNTVSADGR